MPDNKISKTSESAIGPTMWGASVLYYARRICELFPIDDDSKLLARQICNNAESISARYVSLNYFTECVDETAREFDADSLGLVLASDSLAEFGLLGEMLATSPTLGEAFAKFPLYSSLITTCAEQFFWRGDKLSYMGQSINDEQLRHKESFNALFMGVLNNIFLHCCGPGSEPKRVYFSFPEPNNLDEYHKKFGPDLIFDQQANMMVFENSDINMPMQSADLNRHERACADLERATKYTPGVITLSSMVLREILKILSSGEVCHGKLNEDHLSEVLGISKKKIQRTLAQNNSTFRALVDLGRYIMAINLLSTSELSVTEIAHKLGYAESSTFSRAFLRWTNTPPNRFRATID